MGRPIPIVLSDPAVERDLIACILTTPGVIPLVVDVLRPDDLLRPEARELYAIAVDLDERGEIPDVTTVVGELRRRGSSVNPILVRDIAADAPAGGKLIARNRANTVARLSTQRDLLEKLRNAADKVASDGADPGAFAAQIATDVLDVTAHRGVAARTIETLISGALNDLEAEASGAMDPPPRTGFRGLDDKLGGLREGWLTIVAARPGNGKSSLAAAVARNIAERRPVLLFSLEMSDDEIATRLLCAEAGVRTDTILKGHATVNDWQRLVEAVGPLSATKLTIVDQPALTVAEIRATVRRTEDVALVVVDYLQLMGNGERRRDQNRATEVADISRGLKVLARETGVPILACCQLNRNVEQRADKRPTLADLRESGALEQDADVVILLHRDAQDPAKVSAIIAKHRSGPTGSVALSFQYEFTRFRDWTE